MTGKLQNMKVWNLKTIKSINSLMDLNSQTGRAEKNLEKTYHLLR